MTKSFARYMAQRRRREAGLCVRRNGSPNARRIGWCKLRAIEGSPYCARHTGGAAEERQELIEAARVNLSGTNLDKVLTLIDGDYRNDPEAVRGAIWELSEGEK